MQLSMKWFVYTLENLTIKGHIDGKRDRGLQLPDKFLWIDDGNMYGRFNKVRKKSHRRVMISYVLKGRDT